MEDPSAKDVGVTISAVRCIFEGVAQRWLSSPSVAEVGLSDALEHSLLAGAHWRPVLTLLIGQLTKVPDVARVSALALSLELAHKSSVIKDDLADGSLERRGVPTMHAAYGVAIAIAVSDLQLAYALDLGDQLNVSRQYIEAYVTLARGQALDILNSSTCFEEALSVNEAKTGFLTGLAASAVADVFPESRNLRTELETIGRCFGNAAQLANDFQEFAPHANGREVGHETRSGRLNAVTWAAMESLPDDESRHLRDLVVGRNLAESELQHLISLATRGPVRSRIQMKIEQNLTEASRALERFPPSEAKSALYWLASSSSRVMKLEF